MTMLAIKAKAALEATSTMQRRSCGPLARLRLARARRPISEAGSAGSSVRVSLARLMTSAAASSTASDDSLSRSRGEGGGIGRLGPDEGRRAGAGGAPRENNNNNNKNKD